MDVKDAVAAAKRYVTDVYAGEGIVNLGLEEVDFDDGSETWRITLGFSRDWEQPMPPRRHPLADVLGEAEGEPVLPRSYKMLRVSDRDGRVESLTDRFDRFHAAEVS